MSKQELPSPHQTHTVINQPPTLENYNLFDQDKALMEALEREGAGWAKENASRFGKVLGEKATMEWGTVANENSPKLKTHDRYGNRIDEVSFHPAWHELMRLSVSYGLHAMPWRDPRPGAHVARAVMFSLASQIEAGHGCPLSMTYSSIPAIRQQPELAKEWEPRITSLEYDPRFLPASQKKGTLCGMAMTEKQGGSDVRENTTQARPVSNKEGPGEEYLITGHKWFCSAPMCDTFLVLAKTPKGLSCFLVPRWLPDGTQNPLRLQRLKDKLGNRSNASSEIEFHNTWARMIGEEGRGVPTIIEMVNHTRLDCVIGATGGMRQALSQALHHAAYRTAFGKRLLEQPLMQNVLADLAIESEAATVTMARLARAYDEFSKNETERRFARLATAISKYWICKRYSPLAVEALECLGGNGFVEESMMPRLYREAPLNSIWEGSGNVICLDVLRALRRDPGLLEIFFGEIQKAKGEKRFDTFVSNLQKDLNSLNEPESQMRRLVERLALAFQASLLIQHGDQNVADAFCASRLTGDRGLAFGTLPNNLAFSEIISRAQPKIG